MNNTTKVLPFNFERFFRKQTQTLNSNTSSALNSQKSLCSKKLNTSKQKTSFPTFQTANETQKWGMMLAFFGQNKTLKTPSLPKASTPIVCTKKEDLRLPHDEGFYMDPFPDFPTDEGFYMDPLPDFPPPKKPIVRKPVKDDYTLPIWGGGDLSTPKPTGPFLNPSLNDLFQTLTFKGTVATGQRSGYWGDPHVNDAENNTHSFDVIGPGTYSLLKDKNIALSAEHKKYDQWGIDVTNQVNLALGNSNLVFNAYGTPTLNGQALEQGKLITLPDGSSLNWNGTNLSVKNANFGEYDLDILRQNGGGGIYFLDTWINSTDKGVFSDGILPTGILGEGFDMDNLVRTKLKFDQESYKV